MQAQIGGFFRVDGYLARIVPTEKGRLDLSDGGDFLRREDQGRNRRLRRVDALAAGEGIRPYRIGGF